MEQNDAWILVGRLVQMALGTTVAASSLALTPSYNYRGVCAAAGSLGLFVLLFGALALYFGINRRWKDSTGARPFLILLSLDVLALIFCIAAPIGIFVNGEWYKWGFEGVFLIPILASWICAIVLIPFIVWTMRGWQRFSRARVNEPTKGYYDPERSGLGGYNLSEQHHVYHHHICHHVCPVHEAKSSFPEGQKSFETTARWSGVSGATTLDYPNIMSVTGAPTREPSKAAPSYRS